MTNDNFDNYDDEPLNVNFAPSGKDLTALARTNLARWLDYLKGNPPLQALERKASQIMSDIQIATGLPGTQDLAIELALAADDGFERLGLWKEWYQHLMNLYVPATERDDRLDQANLFRCLMHYYVNQGDVQRARWVINALLDIAHNDLETSALDAMVNSVSVSAMLADSDEGVVLGEQLLDLTFLTGDMILMSKTCGVLAQFYTYRNDPQRTFQYGQMTYWVGLTVDEDAAIINGLHYMGIAFVLENQSRRAFRYLQKAVAYSVNSGDASQLTFIRYTWGLCCYISEQYERAEYFFSYCVRAFTGHGTHYARAIYMYGLSLMRLERYCEAEKAMREAHKVWGEMRRTFDQLYAEHSLAHNAWLDGKYEQAVNLAEKTLARAKSVDDPRCNAFTAELNKDLQKYLASRDGIA